MKLFRLHGIFSANLNTPKILRKSDERYRSIFENSLEGMFVSTPEGRFLAVNNALVKMLGYDTVEEVLALKIPDDLYADPAVRIQIQAAYDSVGLAKGVETLF